ncbi:MAG: hypothetical protein IH947_12170 [Bacteroidetes bacterium]|nr:hypothetical protein [Bacteroidota bacterium]
MPESEKKLFLLDAYALIYRAHFAFIKNPRITSKGKNTGVMFGFTNSLLEVLQKQQPTHIGVAFDLPGPTFRHEAYKEYKANRQETPEDIKEGVPVVKEIIKAFNIPILELPTYEADDIIGTIAKKAKKKGFTVYMMTPDKDFGQLVDDKILLYKPAFMGNAVDIMGVEEIKEKWGIDHVDQVRDMLGMQGDASDNIPGIPGVGPKTAQKYIKAYGSVESLVEHAHELKGKQKENVEKYGAQGIMSKQLATIVTDAPIDFKPEELKYESPDESKLRPLFEELEFLEGGPFTSDDRKVALLGKTLARNLNKKVGDTIRLKVLRDQRTLEFSYTLEAEPHTKWAEAFRKSGELKARRGIAVENR